MKKLLTTILILFSLIGTELKGQGLGVDHLEQTKRMARRNNHITKTYNGEIVKMLFGKSDYGSAFDGVIFRKPDGKLLHLRLLSFHGESIGPHIREGQKVEVTITGDELLLDVVLHKGLYHQSLEVKLKESISGLGYLESVRTPEGLFKAEKTSNDIGSSITINHPVVNAKVMKRIKLRNKGAILSLDNGDSLYFQRHGILEDVFNQDYVSYLRPEKKGRGFYFKSQNVHRMSTGNSQFAPAGNFDINLLGFGNDFLQQQRVKVLSFSSNRAGLINTMLAENKEREKNSFQFSTKNAKVIDSLVKEAQGASLNIYYQERPFGDFVRAVEYNGQVFETNRSEMAFVIGQNYFDEIVEFTGKVTDIQFQNGKRFRSMILDDSVHITIKEVIELSIADILEEGTEVTVRGWKRREIPSEINEKGYTIILPKKVTVDGRTFTNRAALTFNE